jgi:hypothetical protein
MKLVIESTDTILSLDGVTVRLWNGVTPEGARVSVLVRAVVVESSGPAAEACERELREMAVPRDGYAIVPLTLDQGDELPDVDETDALARAMCRHKGN